MKGFVETDLWEYVRRIEAPILYVLDGRSTTSLGTSIVETAALARALGMRDAINLDGGGSTTMVQNGQVVNSPSDSTGERPVGDAILLLPAREGRWPNR